MARSEIELIQRTLDGDETAFGFLVDKYKGAIHALACFQHQLRSY